MDKLFKSVLLPVFLILLFLFNISSVYAATGSTTVNASADSFVQSNYPSRNYGKTSPLLTNNSPVRISYLKYDLSAFSGKVIKSASLKLYIKDPSTDLQAIKTTLNSSWSESSINYNNRPALSSANPATFTPSKTGIFTVDLTSAVLARSNNTFSFAITSAGKNQFSFNSREAASNKPVLVITYDTAEPTMPAPTVPASITPTVIPTITPTATPDPTPSPITNDYVIFNDTLASGFSSWSWDSNINFTNNNPVYQGNLSIKYQATNIYSGMDLHNIGLFNTTGYSALAFAVMRTDTNSHYAVYLTDKNNVKLTDPVPLSDFGQESTAGVWKTYRIPLSSLNAVNTQISGFILHDISGNNNSLIYIDEITLIGDTQPVNPPIITDNIPNNSVEEVNPQDNNKPNGWLTSSWGTNSAVFSYESSGFNSSRSIKTTVTSYSTGDAKWYFTPAVLSPNTQYTFSDYYKSDVTSRVVVWMNLTDGTEQYIELKSAPASSDWMKYTDSFTTPANVKSVSVFHLLSMVGYVITDDYHINVYAPAGFSRGMVSITFDDGVASQYTKAYPLLKQYDLHATFYLTSGFLNTDFYMTSSQAAEVKSNGNELAAHTRTHPHLTQLSEVDLVNELSQSQIDLRNMFGGSFNNFCTPYGEYNDQVISVIKQYYGSHRSVEPGFNSKDNFNIYDLKVQDVATGTPTMQVKAWIDQAAADKTWLILVYHQLDNQSDPYSITSSDFEAELNMLKNSGVYVGTVDDVLNEIKPQIAG